MAIEYNSGAPGGDDRGCPDYGEWLLRNCKIDALIGDERSQPDVCLTAIAICCHVSESTRPDRRSNCRDARNDTPDNFAKCLARRIEASLLSQDASHHKSRNTHPTELQHRPILLL
jgi:hypothetical protein